MSKLSVIDPIDAQVGQRLRAFRLAKGVSQAALAAGVGISFQQVQKYEQGKNRISASVMCKLADRLQINPADLLPPEQCGRPHDWMSGALQTKAVVEALGLISKLTEPRQRQALKILQVLVEDEQEAFPEKQVEAMGVGRAVRTRLQNC